MFVFDLVARRLTPLRGSTAAETDIVWGQPAGTTHRPTKITIDRVQEPLQGAALCLALVRARSLHAIGLALWLARFLDEDPARSQE